MMQQNFSKHKKPILVVSLAISICMGGSVPDAPSAKADETGILVQSTTSTANSGLYKHLLPLFYADHDIKVNVVAVGTGQAIKNARNCDADILLVHAKASEELFVAAGYGIKRFDLMYNDFVLVGPVDDPVAVAGSSTISEALLKINQGTTPFASRGDNSGTHKKELSLWKAAGAKPADSIYRSTGSGMGATLNIAVGLGAYTITDRATWTTFSNKDGFDVLFQGAEELLNQYGIIAVNPAKCPNVNSKASRVFIDWMLSPKGQEAIGAYRRGGQQLFFPNAKAQARKSTD